MIKLMLTEKESQYIQELLQDRAYRLDHEGETDTYIDREKTLNAGLHNKVVRCHEVFKQ